jgi:hypothetical protein
VADGLACDLLDAELRVTMPGDERPGGWAAIPDGLVTALGDAGEEPEAVGTRDAAGRLVASGLGDPHPPHVPEPDSSVDEMLKQHAEISRPWQGLRA